MSEYFDSDGNKCTIQQMVKLEPEWTASRFEVMESALVTKDQQISDLQAQVSRLQGIADVHNEEADKDRKQINRLTRELKHSEAELDEARKVVDWLIENMEGCHSPFEPCPSPDPSCAKCWLEHAKQQLKENDAHQDIKDGAALT